MNYAKPSKRSSNVHCRPGRTSQQWPGLSPNACRYGLSSRSTASAVLLGTVRAARAVPPVVWYMVLGLLVGWMAVTAVKSALNMPTVYRSWTSKECVKVINADGKPGSCRHLPDKYRNIWVY